MVSLLDIVATPQYVNLLRSFKYLQIQPLASTTYAHNDQIIFSLESINDHFLPAQSFIVVEGEITKKPATSDVNFVENGLLHAFSECAYLLNSVEIDRTRNLGVASSMKIACSLTPDEASALSSALIGSGLKMTDVVATNGQFQLCLSLIHISEPTRPY